MLIKKCTLCELSQTRKQIVSGRGSIPAQLLFLNDCPDKSDELIGNALIGPGGKLIDIMLNDAEISLSYYILNCIACRPCDSKNSPNREPKPHEILACMPKVHAQILKIKPCKIIFLGKIVAKYYKKEYKNSLTIVHPTYLIKTGGRASPYYNQTVRALKEFCNDQKIN